MLFLLLVSKSFDIKLTGETVRNVGQFITDSNSD